MAYRFATKPYAFDDGVLFAIRLDDQIRQAKGLSLAEGEMILIGHEDL